MADTVELKRCPFCGSEAILDTDLDEAWCSCQTCYASTDSSHLGSRAVANWNRRAIFRNCDRFQGERALDEALAAYAAEGAIRHSSFAEWLLAAVTEAK